MDNLPASSVSDGLQSAYDAQYDPASQPWREIGARAKAENIAELCEGLDVDSVIEIGAGEGALIDRLRQGWSRPSEWFAIEISRSGLELIRQREIPGLVEAKHFDGYSIPYADQQFGVAILSHVLEHVEFPRATLREMARVSKFQAIEVPLDYRFNVDADFESLTSYGHINLYTPTLLRFLLRSEGFEILGDKLAPLSWEAKRFMKSGGDEAAVPTLESLRRYWSELRFRLSSRERQERKAYTYTVLCKKENSLKIF